MERDTQKKEKPERDGSAIHFDYKNLELLKEFLNPHARVVGRRRSRLSAHEQRRLALSVKRARFMALIPYIAR